MPKIVGEALIKYRVWLESADGRKLDNKTSTQHAKQVLKLLSVIDEKKEVSSLFNHALVNDTFLEGHAKETYHPKTTQSYLMSLRHFYSFALTEELNADLDISKEDIIALKEKVSRRSSSFAKSCSKRHWHKMETDRQLLIMPEQMKEFERSKAKRHAVCLLGQLSGHKPLRYLLLVQITVDNASRAGALANMKLSELESAHKQGGDFVVTIKVHKTIVTHGPARIVLNAKLHSWMQIFVAQVCPAACKSSNNDKCVLLSWTGEPLASSQINKALKSIWKKADLHGTPSFTLFRKSAVTGVHSLKDSSELKGNLADLMAHNSGIAQKYYSLHEKSPSSVKASKKLRKVMRGETNEEDDRYADLKSCATSTLADDATSEECLSMSRVPWGSEKEEILKTLFIEESDKKGV